jgi:hypothetical protein
MYIPAAKQGMKSLPLNKSLGSQSEVDGQLCSTSFSYRIPDSPTGSNSNLYSPSQNNISKFIKVVPLNNSQRPSPQNSPFSSSLKSDHSNSTFSPNLFPEEYDSRTSINETKNDFSSQLNNSSVENVSFSTEESKRKNRDEIEIYCYYFDFSRKLKVFLLESFYFIVFQVPTPLILSLDQTVSDLVKMAQTEFDSSSSLSSY